METAVQDIRYAFRGFHRNPVFTMSILLTLALGIGTTTAVFSVVDRVLFRRLPYADADRIVSVGFVQRTLQAVHLAASSVWPSV